MAEEVVAGQDVVDLEALAAGKSFAHIALQERVVADELVPLAIAELTLTRRAAAGLAVERRRHFVFPGFPGKWFRAYHRGEGGGTLSSLSLSVYNGERLQR
jgi:hypothetical protein